MTKTSRFIYWLVLLVAMQSGFTFAQNANVNSNNTASDDPEAQYKAYIALLNKPVASDEIIASVCATNMYYGFDQTLAGRVIQQRRHFIESLVKIFNDSKTSDDQRGAAAFYLGEMRAIEAVAPLSKNITLQIRLGATYGSTVTTPSIPVALVKIGAPAVPALIRNLQDSDDAKVKKLSLEVLCTIEGDKDVVKFRLQKALDAETDKVKCNRLESALKALHETKSYHLMLED